MAADRRLRWLLASLALQNLGRRKARSLLLIAAVAIGSGVVFTGAVLMRSIDRSMAVGFTRLGADMMVVPEGALTNITAALLTVEPTDLVLDADLPRQGRARRASAAVAAAEDRAGRAFGHRQPSRVGRPDRLRSRARLHRPALARREAQSAAAAGRRHPGRGARRRRWARELLIFGKPHVVYGRLGRTGVGTHERGVFMSFATLEALASAIARRRRGSAAAVLAPGKVTRLPGRAGARRHAAAGALRHPVEREGRQGRGRRHHAVAASARAWRRCSTASSP